MENAQDAIVSTSHARTPEFPRKPAPKFPPIKKFWISKNSKIVVSVVSVLVSVVSNNSQIHPQHPTKQRSSPQSHLFRYFLNIYQSLLGARETLQ